MPRYIIGQVLVLLWLFTFAPDGQLLIGCDDPATNGAFDAPRTAIELLHEMRRLEKAIADADKDGERASHIAEFCGLFIEIGEHPEITRNPTLQQLSLRVRTRLSGVERRTITELKRRKIPMPAEMEAQERDDRMRRARGLPPRSLNSSSSESANASSAHTPTPSVSVNNDQTGHAAPGPDFGWQLVNLIRMTIRPGYWSTAGGPGKALYFGQSRALVIHGSWRVHEDVADLLNALRGG